MRLPSDLLAPALLFSGWLCGSTSAQAPTNDDCTGALRIAPGVNGPFTTRDATPSLPPLCGGREKDICFVQRASPLSLCPGSQCHLGVEAWSIALGRTHHLPIPYEPWIAGLPIGAQALVVSTTSPWDCVDPAHRSTASNTLVFDL